MNKTEQNIQGSPKLNLKHQLGLSKFSFQLIQVNSNSPTQDETRHQILQSKTSHDILL